MLLLGLFVLSLIVGGIVFFVMLGRDAWLIKGLRRDDIRAILVACVMLVVGLGMLLGFRMFLPKIPRALAVAMTPAQEWSPDTVQTAGMDTPCADAIGWFLSLCAPILTSLLLYSIYSTGGWLIRCLSPGQTE